MISSKTLVFWALFLIILIGGGATLTTLIWQFKNGFAERLQHDMAKTSLMKTSVGEVDVFFWSGLANISEITFSDRDKTVKPLLAVRNLQISFDPLSLAFSPLIIETIKSSDTQIVANITGDGSRLLTWNKSLKDSFHPEEFKNSGQYRISTLDLGSGVMAIGPNNLNASPIRTIPFPKSYIDMKAEGLTELSSENQVRRILIEITDQALNATSYSLIK
ncbi:hypothetical protein [Sneathiella limimaris]|uniref:hypothetical protein n=1 Tax=Sneathiella limimaris TaxID=1964213 RepID=UPI00146D2F4C|nr:hypothetical protein [Sneathiella limimaris]